MALRELLNDQAGNARKGKRYRDVVRGGQRVHDYASGPDQVVGPAAARATATGGHGQAAQPFQAATSLGGLLRGVGAYEQQGGTQGSMLDSHLHDAGGAAPGANAKGEQFAQLEVGGRKFHVYFSPDGQRVVKEIKRAPTFTPTPAP